MCPMIAMCASVARAGAVRVMIASGRPSQPERNVGERVDISRLAALRRGRELGLDHEQSLVVVTGVLTGWSRERPDDPFAVI